jgi:hypothetical protein
MPRHKRTSFTAIAATDIHRQSRKVRLRVLWRYSAFKRMLRLAGEPSGHPRVHWPSQPRHDAAVCPGRQQGKAERGEDDLRATKSQNESTPYVESFFGVCSSRSYTGAPDRTRAPDLASASEPPSETLEQRVARLSISIGAQAAAAPIIQDRQMILETARVEVIEDLVERGHPLHEAALIADDIIEGARRLASALAARPWRP